ncbi:MAG: hypothetical protein Q8R42_06975, partial [Desulfocapsaceae bacterium]|nr:hypothetical protein [Desulfocapsaceae bacterium]
MSGDVHVRFCESPRGKLPRATRLILLHRDPAPLHQWRLQIEGFLREKLGLELKQPVILHPV